jgi:hypothetical protein
MPPEPVTSLPGTGSRASKRARVTPYAATEAAVATPERRVLEPVFVIDHAFVSRAVGRLTGEDIKDTVQGLIQAHKSADEAGVTGLPQPEGSFADLKDVGVEASIRLLTALAKFGNWKCGTSTPDLSSDYGLP